MTLSDADREALNASLTVAWDCVTVAEFDAEAEVIFAAVEAIVDRAVTQALTEAAEAVEEARSSHVYRCACTECAVSERACRIIRARNPT